MEKENGRFFAHSSSLQAAFEKALELAASREMKILTHENNGKPTPDHVSWFIHKETGCNLLLLHVNVGILKEKTAEYYTIIREIAGCLKAY